MCIALERACHSKKKFKRAPATNDLNAFSATNCANLLQLVMASTSSRHERTPLELLQEICSFLEGPDLHAASYSCKAWRQGTVHLLFSRVIIPVVNDRPKVKHVDSSHRASQTFYVSMLKHICWLTIRDLTDVLLVTS